MALPFGSHGVGDWALIGYLGVFQIALAYVLVTRALNEIPALEASLILLIEPALNPVWAWLFQGERPERLGAGRRRRDPRRDDDPGRARRPPAEDGAVELDAETRRVPAG